MIRRSDYQKYTRNVPINAPGVDRDSFSWDLVREALERAYLEVKSIKGSDSKGQDFQENINLCFATVKADGPIAQAGSTTKNVSELATAFNFISQTIQTLLANEAKLINFFGEIDFVHMQTELNRARDLCFNGEAQKRHDMEKFGLESFEIDAELAKLELIKDPKPYTLEDVKKLYATVKDSKILDGHNYNEMKVEFKELLEKIHFIVENLPTYFKKMVQELNAAQKSATGVSNIFVRRDISNLLSKLKMLEQKMDKSRIFTEGGVELKAKSKSVVEKKIELDEQSHFSSAASTLFHQKGGAGAGAGSHGMSAHHSSQNDSKSSTTPRKGDRGS